MIDYYRVLRIPYTSTSKEIKSAYIALALKCHPDVNKSPDAAHKFKLLGEAYEFLKCDINRAEFLRHQQGGETWHTHSDTYNNHKYHSSWDQASSQDKNEFRDKMELMYIFERLVHPTNLLLFVLPMGIMLIWISRNVNNKQVTLDEESQVHAWWNTKTNQWESPAPWDAEYRALKPPLKLVDRHLVKASAQQRKL